MELNKAQSKHIEIIKAILNIIPNNYVLKGGTALILDYQLDRFSQDIDLDYIINNKQQTNLKNSIIKFCNKNHYQYYIKKDTNSVLRIIVKYDENNSLKIESSSRDIVDENEYSISANGNYNVYHLKTLAQKKLDAFINRDKFRDLYDINFLLNQNVFDEKQISNIQNRFNSKNEKMFIEELQADSILNSNLNLTDFLYEFISNLEKNLKH